MSAGFTATLRELAHTGLLDDTPAARAASLSTPSLPVTVEALFEAAAALDATTEPNDQGCLLWTGPVKRLPSHPRRALRPQIWCRSLRHHLAGHRTAFAIAVRPVPAHRAIGNACGDARCLAPAHLVVPAELRRGPVAHPGGRRAMPTADTTTQPAPSLPPIYGRVELPTERRPLPRTEQIAIARLVDDLGGDEEALAVMAHFAGLPLAQVQEIVESFPVPAPVRRARKTSPAPKEN